MLSAVLFLLASGAPHAGESPDALASWPPEAQRHKVVYVLSHGWHTGIAVRRADIPDNLWPEKADFPSAAYLEVGWGDETFYQAREVTLGMALEAALTPTRSVLHVVGFDESVARFFPSSGIVELHVSDQGLHDLLQYVHDAVERQNASRASALGAGLYGNGRFYRAHGTYSLLNNSNHWVARALASSGAPVEPNKATTAGEVFRQISQVGQVIRPAPS